MKKYLYLTMMAIMAMCLTTACGDDKDDEPEYQQEYQNGDDTTLFTANKQGIHRMDVTITGNTENKGFQMQFLGAREDGTRTKLYEGGQELGRQDVTGVYVMDDIRPISVSTESSAVYLVLVVYQVIYTLDEDVVITIKSYYNDKLIGTDTVTFKAGSNSNSFAYYAYGNGTKFQKIN